MIKLLDHQEQPQQHAALVQQADYGLHAVNITGKKQMKVYKAVNVFHTVNK
jgi:hypothetical protein